MTDYGYGDASPDYGYGATEPDYGYGDAKPEEDYGYGDAKPEEDYGYGKAEPANADYGYGDAGPDEGYGYGDAAPEPAPVVTRKPKRRCSVTKFTLESSDAGTQEAEMAQQLHSVNMINQLRTGGMQPSAPAPAVLTPNKDEASADTMAPSDDEGGMHEALHDGPKKNGVFSRIRKRLSVA